LKHVVKIAMVEFGNVTRIKVEIISQGEINAKFEFVGRPTCILELFHVEITKHFESDDLILWYNNAHPILDNGTQWCYTQYQ